MDRLLNGIQQFFILRPCILQSVFDVLKPKSNEKEFRNKPEKYRTQVTEKWRGEEI